jgi:hypothetical protein
MVFEIVVAVSITLSVALTAEITTRHERALPKPMSILRMKRGVLFSFHAHSRLIYMLVSRPWSQAYSS